MQFNCTANFKDIIKNQLIDKTFNFFVAYPIDINNEKNQLNFFNDIFNQGNLTLNMSLNIRDVKEIMNNYNMFENLYFYMGMYFLFFIFLYFKIRVKKFLWL